MRLFVKHLCDVDRHDRQDGDAVFHEMGKEVGREYHFMNRQCGAFVECAKYLVESVVEVEREYAADDIALFEFQVLCHDSGAVDQVAVGDDNPFGQSRSGETVGNDGIVEAFDFGFVVFVVIFVNLLERDTLFIHRLVGDHFAAEVGCCDIFAFGFVGDDTPDVAVVDDILHLFGFERTGDGYEDILGREQSEDGDDLFDAFVGVDADARPFGESEFTEIVGDLVHFSEKFAESEASVAVDEGGFVAVCPAGDFEKVSDTVD